MEAAPFQRTGADGFGGYQNAVKGKQAEEQKVGTKNLHNPGQAFGNAKIHSAHGQHDHEGRHLAKGEKGQQEISGNP